MAYAEQHGGKLTGRWSGRVRKNGKVFHRTFDTKAAAEGYETYVKITGDEPPNLSGGAGVTFAHAADDCRRAGGARGKWKHGRDHSVIKRLEYVIDVLGPLDIEQAASLEHLENLVDNLSRRRINGRPITGATINRYLMAASSVFTYAKKRGWLTTMPEMPKQKDSNARKHTLTPEIERAVLSHMREQGWHKEALCVEWLAASGMRAGELYALAPEQIGNDVVQLWGDQTKNDMPRKVYVDAELCRQMRALIVAGAVPKRYLLLRKFKKACKACGQSERLVIHSLRHTTATRLLALGVDVQVTQEILGHKNIKTTLGYRHVADEMKLEAAKKLALLRGQSAETGVVVPFEPHKKVS
jgi:integrase